MHIDRPHCILNLMSIQTPLGVYTPTRILQGSTDAGNHFHSSTSQVFTEIENHLLQWLDDFLLHAEHEQQLLELLRCFIQNCRRYGLKLHAEKLHLFMREAKFWGRVIDSEGVRYDPRSLSTLMEMRTPELAGDIQQFICATNRMRNSIPEYSKVVAPLHNLMEQFYNARSVQNELCAT